MGELRKGVFYSVIFHLALIGLFSSIVINLKPRLPEFVELILPALASVPEQKIVEKKVKPEKVVLPEIKYPEPEPRLPEPEEVEREVTEVVPEKYTPSVGEEVGSDAYTITGEIATRKVIYKVLPKYPEGYNVEVKVSIQVQVLPDGTVGGIRLVKKGGPPFDELTERALREWKFEPLPPGAPQLTQQGRITFIYRLR